MDLNCSTDARRDLVRGTSGRNGLDYVELSDDQLTLYVYFLGKLPAELSRRMNGLERYLRIEGGERVTAIGIVDVQPQVDPDPERDDCLVVRLDRYGDFSTYTVRLVGVAGIDPFYDSVEFSFKVGCPSDLDCAPACGCEPPVLDEPRINYLAKDYGSFRQLILDRMALLLPDWTERHAPDLGVTLVELLAYVGDYLSYYQDAVATEAYLGTARQRISVRRHVRLVDYYLHEGCNARAWVHLDVSQDLDRLLPTQVGFITGLNSALPLKQTLLTEAQLASVASSAYEFFEPLVADPAAPLRLRAAHNEIRFYTWGRRQCCLDKGATGASLLDQWQAPSIPAPPSTANADRTAGAAVATQARPSRALQIAVGDVLIFEEVLGAKTGVAADADPARRHAVRVTRVRQTEDALYPVTLGQGDAASSLPTPVLEIEWAQADALPFALCLSAIGAAPQCALIQDISVARGNIVLVDHGRTQPPQDLGSVPAAAASSCCECEGHPSEAQEENAPYAPALAATPLTHGVALPAMPPPAVQTLLQDERAAVPALQLSDDSPAVWRVRQDLLASGPDDRDVVVEIDDDGIGHLRFGDGELGRSPQAGSEFKAVCRSGNGIAGNVGAEAILQLVLKGTTLDGISIAVRNPLAAQGGVNPEPLAEAKLFAPAAFRKTLERAIVADDYAAIAARDARLQRACATLAWTGSWYEADVAVDPWGTETADPALLRQIACSLRQYRRMGHDLRVQQALYVPIKLSLEVCALPGYDRGHVKAALLKRFSNRTSADGTRGFFAADNLSFGDGIYLSQIVAAAQAVAGVECVTVTELHRCLEPPNQELQNGLLPLGVNEIAQLDNDPSYPEHGQLQILMRGGR